MSRRRCLDWGNIVFEKLCEQQLWATEEEEKKFELTEELNEMFQEVFLWLNFVENELSMKNNKKKKIKTSSTSTSSSSSSTSTSTSTSTTTTKQKKSKLDSKTKKAKKQRVLMVSDQDLLPRVILESAARTIPRKLWLVHVIVYFVLFFSFILSVAGIGGIEKSWVFHSVIFGVWSWSSFSIQISFNPVVLRIMRFSFQRFLVLIVAISWVLTSVPLFSYGPRTLFSIAMCVSLYQITSSSAFHHEGLRYRALLFCAAIFTLVVLSLVLYLDLGADIDIDLEIRLHIIPGSLEFQYRFVFAFIEKALTIALLFTKQLLHLYFWRNSCTVITCRVYKKRMTEKHLQAHRFYYQYFCCCC